MNKRYTFPKGPENPRWGKGRPENKITSDKHYAFPKGELHPHWKGGRKISQGYVLVLKPDHPNANKTGYVREHVLIMSLHLGRPIAANEVVHHINGIRDDNRLENLVLMTRQEHTSNHTKGNVKPASIAALKPGATSEQMRQRWATTLAHKRRKPIPCPVCGKEFVSRQKTYKYCSLACYYLSRRKDHVAAP